VNISYCLRIQRLESSPSIAASYGAKYGERLPFSKSGEPIRYGVFVGEKRSRLLIATEKVEFLDDPEKSEE
jgi:hypothetical protein